MKKFLLTFALAAACTAGVSAQSYLLDNPANKGYFGIRASGEVSCPGKVGDDHKVSLFKNGGGFEVGSADDFASLMDGFAGDGNRLAEAGKDAADFVAGCTGATAKILADVPL